MVSSAAAASRELNFVVEPQSGHRARRFSRIRTAAVLASGTAFAALSAPANAQDRVYSGPGPDWTTATNWTGGNVADNPAETAVFQNNAAPTTINLASSIGINGIRYDAGAQSRTINAAQLLTMYGTGIVNNSGNIQTININGAAQGSASLQLAGSSDVTGTQTNVQLTNGFMQIAQTANATRAHAMVGAGGILSMETTDGTGTLGALSGSGIVTAIQNNGAVTNQVLTVGGLNLSTVFSGTITQNAGMTLGITVAGTGTLSLTGASAYTGATTVNTGATLQIGSGGTTGSISASSAVDLAGGRLVIDRSDAITFGNTVSGNGSFVYSGLGSVRLTGNNSFSGGSSVGAGTITLGSANALGTGPLTFILNGRARTDIANATINGVTINAGESATFSAAAGDLLTLTGTLNMASAAGTQIHFGAPGDTGTVFANFSGVGQLPNVGSGSVDFGTLRGSDNFSFLLLNLNGGLNIATGATYDINGAIGAAVNLSGGGTVTNNGAIANQFQAQQTGPTTFGGSIQDGSKATALLVRGGGTLVLTGASTYTGATTFASGSTLQLGNGGTTGSIGTATAVDLTSGRLVFNRSDAVTLSNILSGTGSLVQSGPGTLRVTGANSYSGGTTINSGVVELGSANGLGTGAVTFAGGSGQVRSTAAAATINGVTINAGQSATLSAAPGDLLTLTGTLNMASAAGTQIHFGAPGQTGTVFANFGSVGQLPNVGSASVDYGTLRGSNSFTFFLLNLNGGVNVAAGATYDINGVFGAAVNLTGGGTITNNGGAAAQFQAQQTGTTTFDGVIQDGSKPTSLLVRGGGTLVLTGASTYSGGTTFSSGSTLQIGNGGPTGSIGAGDIDLTSGHLVINRAGALTLAGTISGTGDVTFAGPGTTTVTGANTYSGATNLQRGVVEVGNTNALGTGTLTFAGGGVATSVRGIATASLGNNLTFTNGANTTFAAVPGTTLTLNGGAFNLNANSPGTQLHFGSATDTGTVVFAPALGVVSGGSGYDLFVDGGTLRAGNVNTLTFLTTLANVNTTVAGGAVLDFSPFGAGSINNLLGSGTVLDDGSTTVIRNANFSGNLGGTQNVGTTGSGTVILTGANSYTGSTTIASGSTLQLGNGGTTGSIANTSNIVDNGTLVVNRSAPTTLAAVISGTGTLTLAGTGTTTLTAVNTYSGATNLQQGVLQVSANNALGTSNLIFAGGGVPTTLRGLATVSLGNNLTFSGGANATIAAATGTILTLNGSTFSINANSPGTQLHFGSATDTGTVVFAPALGVVSGGSGYNLFVDGGTLRAGNVNTLTFLTTLANVNTTVAGGAVLDFSAFGAGSINNLLGSGTVLDDGSTTVIRNGQFGGNLAGTQNVNLTSGLLVLTGANTYTGTTTIAAGATLRLDGTGSITNTGRIADNGTLVYNKADDGVAGLIVGAGTVIQSGPGRIAFIGNNTAGNDFTGTISVNAGTVLINGKVGDSSNGLADLVVNSGGTLGGSGTFYGDVTVTGNGQINPGNSPGTLTIGGDLNLGAGTILNYEFSQPNVIGGPGNDLINVGGNLTLDGTLNVAALPGFGPGYYRLVNYGGTLTDNGLAFGTMPAGYNPTLLTNVAGQVNLLFASGPGGQLVQYWDGLDTTGVSATPTGDGGPGIWNSTSTNWTVPPGWNFNDQWRGQVGVFAGTQGGFVTVQGTQSFQELRFQHDGYALNGAGGLATTGGFSVIDVSPSVGASISVNIAGTGGLTKTGDGLLQLNGANTYAGVTTVSGGTLVLGGVGIIANGVVNNATFTNFGTVNGGVVNTGTLTSTGSISGGLNNSGTATISGQLIGAVANSGTLVLNGPMSGIGAFTQATTGATRVGGAISFGSLAGAGTIALGSTGALTVGGDNSSTAFSGVISGTAGSSLTKTGIGTLLLSGNNTFSGPTFVNQGILQVQGGQALSDTAGVTVGSAGFLQLLSSETVGSIAGSGLIRFTGVTLVAGGDNSSTTFSGALQGTGGIFGKVGTGTLTLSGANTFTGLATVGFGALTLTSTGSLAGDLLNLGTFTNAGTVGGLVTNSGAMTSTGSLLGGLTNSGTVNLQGRIEGAITNNAGTITVTGGTQGTHSFTQAAGANLVLQAGTFAVNGFSGGGSVQIGAAAGFLVSTQGSQTYSGSISGAGAMGLASGDLTLSGVNSHLGTIIFGGRLRLLSNSAGGGDIDFFNNSVPATLSYGNGINRAGTVTLESTGAQLEVLTGETATQSGVIQQTGGSFGITKIGAGTLILTGANTYTGLTAITGGTLSLSGGAAIADTGAVLVNTGGTLNLASSETIGSLSGLPGSFVTLGANTLTTGGTGGNTTFAGVMSGTGGLTKVGPGILALTGANTYSGVTTISAGVLQIGNGGTTGSIGTGNIVDNATLAIGRSDAITLANNISGTGMVAQASTGTTTLTGTNSYTGGTLVSAGRLIGNTVSLQGNITDNAALEFNQSTNGIFAGRISGTGTLDKTGTGLVELTGDNSGLTGATFVRAGELRVSNLLNHSATTVLSGGTLSGTSTVGGLTVQSGGTVSPGGPTAIGTLGVNGNITLASGSTYAAQLVGPAGADLILGNGTASIAGTLALGNLGGTYAFNSTYTVLQAASRTGTFDTLTGTNAFGVLYQPQLVYTANQVLVRLAPNTLANIVSNQTLTPNERSVQQRIDAAVAGGYNPQPLFAIYSLPQAQLPGAFDQLSGEVYASAAGAGIEQERLMREAVLNRLSSTAAAGRADPASAHGAGMWGHAYGSWGSTNGDGNASMSDTDRQGFAVGIDFGGANDHSTWRVGAFGQYIKTRVSVDLLGSNADIEETGGGLYAGFTTGNLGVSVGGSYGQIDLSARRTIALPGFTESERGQADGEAYQAFGEISYAIPSGNWTFRPFIAGHVGSFKLEGLTETGGAAALSVGRQDYTTATGTAGVNAQASLGNVRLTGSLGARAQLGDRDLRLPIALSAAPTQSFDIRGVQLDDVALAAQLDATFRLGNRVDLSVGYSGLIGERQRDHGARATLSIRF